MEPASPLEPPDSSLLEASRAGDAEAFRKLVERYQGPLRATAQGMLGPCPEVEEVVQGAFLRFYRALDRFEGRSALGTYLTRIAMNEALKVIQKRQRWRARFQSSEDPEKTLVEMDSRPQPSALETEERLAAIRAAVQALKPEFRSVVVLRFLNGYTTLECAEMLGLPPGTVMSRLSRALEKLGPALQPLRHHV